MLSFTNFMYAGIGFNVVYNGSDTSGLGCITEIVTNNEYVLNKFSGYESKVFIDIGANIGIATIIMAKLNPNSIVYSFEPTKACFDILEKNIKLNDLTNVRAYQMALAKADVHELELMVNQEMTGANSLYADVGGFENTYCGRTISIERVKCTTLDSFLKSNSIPSVKLLKIDCEGAEYDIIYESELFKTGVVNNMVGEFHNLKNLTGINNSADLQTYCKKYVDGYIGVTTLDLTQNY